MCNDPPTAAPAIIEQLHFILSLQSQYGTQVMGLRLGQFKLSDRQYLNMNPTQHAAIITPCAHGTIQAEGLI
jgi:hypothetical protein